MRDSLARPEMERPRIVASGRSEMKPSRPEIENVLVLSTRLDATHTLAGWAVQPGGGGEHPTRWAFPCALPRPRCSHATSLPSPPPVYNGAAAPLPPPISGPVLY
jgi:hypothetical protein